MSAQFARIVPGPVGEGGAHRTQGTQVLVGDQVLSGVTGITLRADVNDVWRATIECVVHAPEVAVEARITRAGPTFWQRLHMWLLWRCEDITGLASTERQWRAMRLSDVFR